jgi:hypothetical protein
VPDPAQVFSGQTLATNGLGQHPTQSVARNLFQPTKQREASAMLMIALGLTVALVAVDVLELSRRGKERKRGLL